MTVKYKNDIDDLVEINVTLGKISLKRWIFNNIFPIVYTIVVLLLVLYLAIQEGGFKPQIGALLFLFVVTSAFLWINTLIFKRNNFRRAMGRIIRKNKDYIQEKAVSRKEKEFSVQNLEDKKKSYKFRVNEVEKVIEKNDFIFLLKKGEKPLVTIPSDSFVNDNEKEQFFKGLHIIRK